MAEAAMVLGISERHSFSLRLIRPLAEQDQGQDPEGGSQRSRAWQSRPPLSLEAFYRDRETDCGAGAGEVPEL